MVVGDGLASVFRFRRYPYIAYSLTFCLYLICILLLLWLDGRQIARHVDRCRNKCVQESTHTHMNCILSTNCQLFDPSKLTVGCFWALWSHFPLVPVSFIIALAHNRGACVSSHVLLNKMPWLRADLMECINELVNAFIWKLLISVNGMISKRWCIDYNLQIDR